MWCVYEALIRKERELQFLTQRFDLNTEVRKASFAGNSIRCRKMECEALRPCRCLWYQSVTCVRSYNGLWRIRTVNHAPGLFYECLDSSDESKTKYTSVGLMLVKFEQNLLMLTPQRIWEGGS